MRPHRLLVLLVLALCLVSCDEKASNARSEYTGIPVSASLPAIADIVRQIGGVRVKVDCLIPVDNDPTNFQVTENTLKRLAAGKFFFHGQTSYEAKLITAAQSVSNLKLVVIGANIPKDQILTDPETGKNIEPAFWGDASLWNKCIDDVFQALVALDPESRSIFEQNVSYYREKLLIIHEWAVRRAQEIPPNHRLLITQTDNLGYFAKAYGFDTLPVESEEDVAKAVEAIHSREIRTVFAEVGVPPQRIEEVSRLSGASLNNDLYGFGPAPIRKVEDYQSETYDISGYVGMVKHNLNTLLENLR